MKVGFWAAMRQQQPQQQQQQRVYYKFIATWLYIKSKKNMQINRRHWIGTCAFINGTMTKLSQNYRVSHNNNEILI